MDGWLNQVAAMDAVISIANTTVHVQVALSTHTMPRKPASDWRWIDPNVYKGCYWYPSVDAYYQENGSWESALNEAPNWLKSQLKASIAA